MKKIRATILTIGDELLLGQTVDTNATFLAQTLSEAGFIVHQKTTVGDDFDAIEQAISESLHQADILIGTGGLGPTNDDMTKHVVTRFFGGTLERFPDVENHIRQLFQKWNREPDQMNLDQALLPTNATLLHNPTGTAMGLWFEHEGKVAAFLPGVPFEMRNITQHAIIPLLKKQFQPSIIQHRKIRTVGTHESVLARRLVDWENALPAAFKLAYLPKAGQVALRLTASGEDSDALRQHLDQEVEKLKPLIGEFIYSYEGENLEEAIGRLLKEREATLATAESCTGGELASLITNIAGSSRYFQGGIVSYSNDLKINQLGVKAETIEQHGAVSKQTACEMAENARLKYQADYALSTTGIAGPTGARPGKPVGTVYIGVSHQNGTFAKRFEFTNDRLLNVQITCTKAFQLLLKILHQ